VASQHSAIHRNEKSASVGARRSTPPKPGRRGPAVTPRSPSFAGGGVYSVGKNTRQREPAGAMPLRSKPIDSGLDHAEILVTQSFRRANVDRTFWQILKLLPKPLTMRSKILKRFAIFQCQIPVNNQFNCL
jgi:hypothetical protein